MTERLSREYEGVESPSPQDLPAFVPYACAQLQAPFAVRVLVQLQDEYVSKIHDDKKKLKGKSAQQFTSRTFDSPARTESASAVSGSCPDDQTIVLIAVCDTAGHVVELQLHRAPAAPRLLLKVIALCAPFQPLLYKLTVRWTPLDGEALHEIGRLPPLAHVTELCLDDSPALHRNYSALLDDATRLRSLSLARCRLDDADCASLAARLAHPLPASRTLALLALAGNRIADAGAVALAAALRTNRTLQYLNLSGNRLTDDGALALLASLAEFPLAADELLAERRRRLEYLRARERLTRRCREELEAATAAERAAEDARGASGRRRTAMPASARSRKSVAGLGAAGVGASSQDALQLRAQATAAELLGPHVAPFGPDDTVVRGGRVRSTGDTTLCALNLAYNALGWRSLARLLAVLRYQEALSAKAGTGLVRVVLEGNPLPDRCAELSAVQDLLDNALSWKLGKPQKGRPERPAAKAKSK